MDGTYIYSKILHLVYKTMYKVKYNLEKICFYNSFLFRINWVTNEFVVYNFEIISAAQNVTNT